MLREFIPDELITEVLSFLPVKSLMRLKCLNKSWKTLISDPAFIKLHLKRSARNKHLALFSRIQQTSYNFRVAPFRLHCLLENTSGTITVPYFPINKDRVSLNVVGSCNGLFCLVGYYHTPTYINYKKILFYLWNPATRTLSNKIKFYCENCFKWRVAFGYDNSTETYKIVVFNPESYEVSVFNFGGNNIWKNIQSFPVVLLPLDRVLASHGYRDVYAHVNDSLNWLVIREESQFVIISLDLSSETYRQLLPPQGFDKVSLVLPTLAMLMDSLCFCHDFNGTNFIIWQMKEFGVQESWIQFLKISYQDLPIVYNVCSRLPLFPLCLSENGDTLVLAWDRGKQAILYNTAEKTGYTDNCKWYGSKEYVESLVSTC
ncbi:F-box/kelch-repeat protein At3g23880-like [Trifolium pratense]|uniref:F-box/kelch-repeat protein At3g23880-like n=1 Tax=Trifolium pratense TaxID=57577 RepID=UPI001E6937FA|nr:F-box/kelch-repeat protein At3g23880-like [Trifolium pratense]